MILQSGGQLGPYRILSAVGSGGMGEVYRAHDPRLGRDIAIKVSAERFSDRFEREARAVAALNHPNICTLHDVGPNYLVMEYIEGESPKGPMPLDDALHIARQITQALEVAHEKGIVHRDLKPGNIKITQDGRVKILDFGLAKRASSSSANDAETSPMMTMGATQAGVILGTAAYMSPEQARGKPADKRADIWAFGVVLFEMLTGERAFRGEDVTETLAAVVRDQPDLSRVPSKVRPLLKSCLQKDPAKRLRDIGDAWQLLDESDAPADIRPTPRRGWIWPATATILLIALGILSLVHFRESQIAAQPVRFELTLPDQIGLPLGSAFAVSPDGRHLAFAGAGADKVTRLWIRSLDTVDARAIAGGEMSATPPPMFWSADSRYVVFQDQTKLKKVDIFGGPVQTLCDITGYVVGGSWNRDGQIILGNNVAGKNGGALMRVSSSGGDCAPLTKLDVSRGERYHSFPTFLPDGRHFIYHRFSGGPTSGIYVGTLDVKPEDQSTQQLVATPNGGAYVPPSGSIPGQILFMRDGTLMSQDFDHQAMALSGEAIPVAAPLGTFQNFAFFSVSANGVLVYRNGGSQAWYGLAWLDRQGKILGKVGESGVFNSLTLSPDGSRAAYSGGDADIWLLDLARGLSTRFTFGRGQSTNPVWSPDGTRIVFASNRDGGVFNLYQKVADGTKEEELLLRSADSKLPTSWSSDGRFLLFSGQDAKTGIDLWVLPVDGGGRKAGERQAFLRTEFYERLAQFSPDMRWVAYVSNESGRDEIYVRPFPPAPDGGKWMVSRGVWGGPAWFGGGRQLRYVTSDFKMNMVEITPGAAFRPDTPKPLFQWPTDVPVASALAPDGRILVPVPEAPGTPEPFTVLLNWQATLKK